MVKRLDSKSMKSTIDGLKGWNSTQLSKSRSFGRYILQINLSNTIFLQGYCICFIPLLDNCYKSHYISEVFLVNAQCLSCHCGNPNLQSTSYHIITFLISSTCRLDFERKETAAFPDNASLLSFRANA